MEACLRAAGAESTQIFLDDTDLASGRSWVLQLQEGVGAAEHLILIATPEALASPRVEDGRTLRTADFSRRTTKQS